MVRFGKVVSVTYNGARVDQYLADDVDAITERLAQHPTYTVDVDPDWFVRQPEE